MNTFIGCLANETGNAQTPFEKLKQRGPKYASRIASPAGEALEKAARPIFTSNYFRTPVQQETRQTAAVRIQFAWVLDRLRVNLKFDDPGVQAVADHCTVDGKLPLKTSANNLKLTG